MSVILGRVKVSEVVPYVGIPEPFAARRQPDEMEVVAKVRGSIDKQEPVSTKKEIAGVDLLELQSSAERVKRPQQRGSPGSAARIGDGISFLKKYNQ